MNALATPAAPPAQTYAEIDVDDIRPSPLNHRKVFRAIAELGESMKAKGQKVPVKVRPVKGPTPYELVYGERRWRAAKNAGIPQLRALIEDLTDVQVLEEQLIENVSREDVHAAEEADGYRQLIDKHGYDVDQLAAKTGKSKGYIYQRLKLCEIGGTFAREAFLDDKISVSIAFLVARIPNPKLQDRYTKEVLEGPKEESTLVHGEWVRVRRPMSYREAHLHLVANYMLRLENAPFPIVDDKLVKGVGSCVGCLFRTGNQRELFDDVKSEDVCTNPPCFAKKREAQADRDIAAWLKEGKKVLPKAEVAKVFQKHGATSEYTLIWNCAYLDASQVAPWDVDRRQRSWAQLFGGEDKVPIVFARDPSGKQWQLIHKASAVKALQKSGALKDKSRTANSNKPRTDTPRERAPSLEELTEDRLKLGAVTAIVDKAAPLLAKHDLALWRWLAGELARMIDWGDGAPLLARLYGFDDNIKVADKIIAKAKTLSDFQRLAIAAVVADRIGGGASAAKPLEGAGAALKLLGIDPKQLKADAVASAQAAVDASAKAHEAKKPKARPERKTAKATKRKGGGK